MASVSLTLQAPELSLPILTGFGLLDSINPCVIGVLLVMLTVLLKTGDKKKILINGGAYVLGVYLTYLLGGLTLLSLFNAVRAIVIIGQLLYFVVGALIMLAGILEIKDYFWYGRWFSLSIPKRFVGYIENKVNTTHTSIAAALFFGSVITLIELPCTGAPYLAILTLMSQSSLNFITGLPLLIFYNLVFILPLLAIIAMVYFGFSIKHFGVWKQEHRGLMRLLTGLALFTVGIWIITTVADYLLWPLIFIALSIITIMAISKYVLKFGEDWPR